MSDSLARVVELANLLLEKERQIDELNGKMKVLKEDYTRLTMEDLPDLMTEVGLSELRLQDGSLVAVRQEVSCAITEAKRRVALDWLVENNFGGLIKTELTITFSSGERDAAEELLGNLADEEGMEQRMEMKEAVHPATLKSFVKERMESGEAFPMELFGVHPYNVASVTKPKLPKGKVKNGSIQE